MGIVDKGSFLNSVNKLFSLMGKHNKILIYRIIIIAVFVSTLEIITASAVVVFAQLLNDPKNASVIPQWFLNWTDLNVGQDGTLRFAFFLGFIYILKNVVSAFEVYNLNFSIQMMNFNFKSQLLNKYGSSDYRNYLKRNSSYNVAVISGDVEQVFSGATVSLACFFSESLIALSLIGLIVYVNPLLSACIFLSFFIVFFIVSKGMSPHFYKWGKKLQAASYMSGLNLLQFFHAYKEVLLFGKRDYFIKEFNNHSFEKSKTQAVQTFANALPRLVIEVSFVLIFLGIIIYLISKNEASSEIFGILGGYFYAGFRVMPSLNRMIHYINNFKSTIPSIERVCQENKLIHEGGSYENIPSFSFKESISVNNLSFSFSDSERNILNNVSFIIRKGECIGLIGETGSGKSTLVDLILGLLISNEKSILIDEKFVPFCIQWHSRIGYVPQAVYLVDDSVKKNIAFGVRDDDVDYKRLHQAIQDAQLASFIDKLPMGLSTEIGERGSRISGGERQRIAIARALYRNPEVLIFDEATSALDSQTEAKLIETINEVAKSRTVIMIAHRLSSLKYCDKVFEVKNGSISELKANVFQGLK